MIVCNRCDRHQFFTETDLLARFGAKPMGRLLKDLTTDCPRSGNTSIYELYQAQLGTAPIA